MGFNLSNALSSAIFGSAGSGILRGPDHASKIFGLNQNTLFLNNPKTKFEHFIRFNINSNPWAQSHFSTYFVQSDYDHIAALVKSATYPSVEITTQTANQYNKKRNYYTSISYKPITVTMHDVADGKTLRFWQMYYSYYFRNGHHSTASNLDRAIEGTDPVKTPTATDFISLDDDPAAGIVLDSETHDTYGLNIQHAGADLLNSIELFYSRAGKYSKVVLVNPKISSFEHDEFNYEETGGLMTITLTIEYETVLYDEMPRDLKDTNDIRQQPGNTNLTRGLKAPELPETGSPAFPSHTGSVAFFNEDDRPANEAIASESSERKAEEQGPFSGVFDNLGNDISSAIQRGITTGDFSLKPNPIDSVKNVANNVINNVKGNAIGAISNSSGSAVGQVAGTITAPITSAANTVASGINSAVGSVTGTIGSAVNTAAQTVDNTVGSLFSGNNSGGSGGGSGSGGGG